MEEWPVSCLSCRQSLGCIEEPSFTVGATAPAFATHNLKVELSTT
jgi:hypothetical protein